MDSRSLIPWAHISNAGAELLLPAWVSLSESLFHEMWVNQVFSVAHGTLQKPGEWLARDARLRKHAEGDGPSGVDQGQ